MTFALLLLGACGSESPAPPYGSEPTCPDGDRDGACLEDDCDDSDPTAYPGAEDVWYSGIDEACDGGDDFDADGDGNPIGELRTWYPVFVPDCDDTDPAIHAGASAVCGNGVDDDCDGREDCSRQGELDSVPLTSARVVGGVALAAGDVDGDGVLEWLLHDGSENLMRALTSGSAHLVDVELATVPNEVGHAFGNVGGVDGADLVVNAPNLEILVYLDPELDTAVDGFIDSGPGGALGLSVGDVTGDGIGDVVLGEDNFSGWVYAGPVDGPRYPEDAVATLLPPAEEAWSSVGEGVEAGGDITGDGIPDVLATVEASASSAGEYVAIFSGPVLGVHSASDVPHVGTDEESFGAAYPHMMNARLDWNGDGYVDLLKHDGADGHLFFGPIDADRAVESSDAYFPDSGGQGVVWGAGGRCPVATSTAMAGRISACSEGAFPASDTPRFCTGRSKANFPPTSGPTSS